MPLQHRMVLTTMYATGLRVSEAVALQVGHLDGRSRMLLVACGKGQKQRRVPLSPTLLEQLRAWWRRHRNPRWWFPGTSSDQPMDTSCLQRACKKAVHRAGLTKAAPPHSLRHTFATELLEAGVNLLIIQRILGHTSIRTTMIYTVPDSLNVVALAHPAEFYHLLFRAARETLLEAAGTSRYLGGQVGGVMVLHTWGQNLSLHPHLHVIVPGGAISPDGQAWRSCPTGFFLPVQVLSRLFRGKLLAYLQESYDAGRLPMTRNQAHLADPCQFRRFLSPLYRKDFPVQGLRPGQLLAADDPDRGRSSGQSYSYSVQRYSYSKGS